MKKIVIVSYEDFPSYTGLFNRLKAELHIFKESKEKFDVALYAPRFNQKGKGEYIIKDSQNTIKIRRLPVFTPRFLIKHIYKTPISKAIALIPFLILLILKLYLDLIKEKASKIIFQVENFILIPPVSIISKVFNAKIIADDINFLYIRRRGLVRQILYLFEFSVIKKASIIFTASEISYKLLKNKGFNNIVYLPNTLPLYKILRYSHCRKKLNRLIEKGQLEIVFIGNFTFYQNIKALKTLINMANKLIKTEGFSRLRINVMGSKIYMLPKNILKSPLIKKGILKIYGDVPENLKKKIFSRSLIGILPYFSDTPRWGGQMYKALEMLSNCMIIITGNEGVKGINGVNKKDFIMVTNVEEMVEAIKKVIKSPEKFLNIPLESIKLIKNNYTTKKIKEKFLKIIKML